MKKNLMLFALLLMSNVMVFAQGGKITFEKETHDFGTVKEETGFVTYEFKFTNTGTTPLIISNVNPSCGCTTPNWTKDPILPGKTGVIQAKFETTNRPGTFNKSLNVTTNGEPSSVILYIKGTVTPKVKTTADELPEKTGSIRMNSKFINLGKISTKEPYIKELDLYNDGDKSITFNNEITAPAHLQVAVFPTTINPKERAIVKITYDTKAKNDLGFVNDYFVINSNDATEPKKEFFITASIEDYFPPMSAAELSNAPKLTIEKKEYNFGLVQDGSTLSTDFIISNSGKQDLVIKKIKSNCACITSSTNNKTLKPGETGKIQISYNTTGRKGIDQKDIAVFTNDPSAPIQTLKIKASNSSTDISTSAGKGK